MKVKFDRRRKYYMILDCETATLPFASNYEVSVKKQIAIAKPLIYDLGYTIIDKSGNIYKRVNHLIIEIFSVPAIFNTAYYAGKRPLYLDKLNKGEIDLISWEMAIDEFIEDLSVVEAVGAYNSMFDFKKAIPFTELYIKNLYSPNYFEWEASQRRVCDSIANGQRKESTKTFDPKIFRFRNITYSLFDVWGLVCEHILNCDEYRKTAVSNNWLSESGKYYKTSAEMAFRFFTGEHDFEEAHTALNDAEIESMLFSECVKRARSFKNLEMGIIYFPFRKVGQVE